MPWRPCFSRRPVHSNGLVWDDEILDDAEIQDAIKNRCPLRQLVFTLPCDAAASRLHLLDWVLARAVLNWCSCQSAWPNATA